MRRTAVSLPETVDGIVNKKHHEPFHVRLGICIHTLLTEIRGNLNRFLGIRRFYGNFLGRGSLVSITLPYLSDSLFEYVPTTLFMKCGGVRYALLYRPGYRLEMRRESLRNRFMTLSIVRHGVRFLVYLLAKRVARKGGAYMP